MIKDLWVCSFIGMFSMGGGGEKGGREGKHLSGDLFKSGLRHFLSEKSLASNLPHQNLELS